MTEARGPRRRALAGYAMVACAAVQWGLWPLVLRAADSIARTDVRLQAALVMAAITVASAPVVLRDRVRARASLAHWLGVSWLGFADAMNVLLFFRAYAVTTVPIAVTTHYLAPVLVAALSPVVLRERSNARVWVAVSIALAGLALMLRPWGGGLGPQDAAGALLGAGSAVFYASNVLVNKRLVSVFSGAEMMFWHGVFAAPLLALAVPREAWASVHPGAALVLALGGVGPGAFAGLLFVWALRRIPASHAMTLTLIEPLTAFVVGFAALRQPVSAVSFGGGALILIAAWLVLRANSSRKA